MSSLRPPSHPALLPLGALFAGLILLAFSSLPRFSAQAGTGTLKALQAERVALSVAFTPAVVAVALQRPVITGDRSTGMAGGGADAASGFVVDGDYVITDLEAGPLRDQRNGDNLSSGGSVWMMAHDGTEFSGKVIGTDVRNLMALIKMGDDHPNLPSVRLGDSDKVAIGSTCMSVGNTLNSMLVDHVTSFSYGTVSGFYRFEPVDVLDPALSDDKENPNPQQGRGDPYKGNMLEVDTATLPGDHGGPIFNLSGEVIGMVSSHYMSGRFLGCAVPSNQLRAVLPQLKKGVAAGELSQGFIGIKVVKPEGEHRILIERVDPKSPAAKAGLKVGQQLVRVDNFLIPNFDRLREMMGTKPMSQRYQGGGGMFGRPRDITVPISYGAPVGTHIQLTLRDPDTGRERTVDVIVGEKAEDF